ncbi:MAG: hypothetical protein Q4D80_01180 [Pseudomonadota bacterium]|nr:hypothetical protein [Pseudomonadota bacterium]
MIFEQKKQRLEAVKQVFHQNISAKGGWFDNVGQVFFTVKTDTSILDKVIYHRPQRYALDIEVLSLDKHYFVGSKKHAKALFDAFGGQYLPSDFCFVPHKPRELWIWRHEEASTCLDFEDAKIALF